MIRKKVEKDFYSGISQFIPLDNVKAYGQYFCIAENFLKEFLKILRETSLRYNSRFFV